MGCATDFLEMLPKFKMAASGQLEKKLWALKLKVRNYSNFTITFPMIWRCAGDFFKVLLKFKMVATYQFKFFGGRKNSQTKVVNYQNFTITFPTIWRCACDFVKVLPKFKMWAQKLTKKLMSEMILLKFKMATTSRLF